MRFRKLKYKDIKTSIEAFFVKIYLQKKKYLLWCCDNPYKSLINEHLFEIGKGQNSYLGSYDIIIGHFNSEIIESSTHEFCSIYYLNRCKQRDYKNFHDRFFHEEFESKLNKLGAPAKNVNTFQFTDVLNKHTTTKTKVSQIKPSRIYGDRTKSRYYVAVRIAKSISEKKTKKHDPLRTRRYISSKETLV